MAKNVITNVDALNRQLLNIASIEEKKQVLKVGIQQIKTAQNLSYKELRKEAFATFHNGVPVDEPQFVTLVVQALKKGKLPAEEGLLLYAISSLPANLQASWAASGFKATKWSKGAISNINKELQVTNKIYYEALEEADSNVPSRLYSITGVVPAPGTEKEFFKKEIVKFLTQESRRVAGGKGTYYTLEIVDAGIVLRGRVLGKDQYIDGKLDLSLPQTYSFEGVPEPDDPIRFVPLMGGETLTESVHMGHGIAEQTQDVRVELDIILEAKKQVTDKSLISFYDESIKVITSILKYMEAIDRMQIQTEAKVSGAGTTLKESFSSLLSYSVALGADEITIVTLSGPGKIDFKTSKMPVDLSASVIFPEPADTNSWKGAKQQVLAQLWRRYLENKITDENFQEFLILATSSTPFGIAHLLKNLSYIFDSKLFEKVIINPKKRKRIQKLKARKTNKIFSTKNLLKILNKNDARISEAQKQIAKGPKKRGRKSAKNIPLSLPSQQAQNILPILNAEIKQYVINEMTYPSLENRSGRFAGSVRVLSAQENAAVQYTYQKSPYQVFSQTKGKTPWSTAERDPAQIIDKAIKKIGMDKFGKVFRTEER
jgi:hypothetical protein